MMPLCVSGILSLIIAKPSIRALEIIFRRIQVNFDLVTNTASVTMAFAPMDANHIPKGHFYFVEFGLMGSVGASMAPSPIFSLKGLTKFFMQLLSSIFLEHSSNISLCGIWSHFLVLTDLSLA